MRTCKCGCGLELPASALRRQLFLNKKHRDGHFNANRHLVALRPTSIHCQWCGRPRKVSPKGRVPTYCEGSECSQAAHQERLRQATIERHAEWRCVLCGGPAREPILHGGARRYCSPTCATRAAVLKRYNLTAEQFVDMARAQGWRCALPSCGVGGGTRELAVRTLCVDHCHATLANRKLLCRTCNSGLGMFRDNPSLTREATAYLEAHETPDQLRRRIFAKTFKPEVIPGAVLDVYAFDKEQEQAAA